MISGLLWALTLMRKIEWTRSIKKDLKKYEFQKDVLKELNLVIQLLLSSQTLPAKYRDHNLSGNWVDFKECHVKSDLLLIYKMTQNELYLARFGSHSELF